MPTIDEVLALAKHHRQAGNFSQAEYLYRQILQADARHADALHQLGLLAFQCGQMEPAVAFIRQALAVNPTSAAYHCNLGLVLTQLGKVDQATAHLRQAVAINPDFAEAHCNLGIALRDLGKHEEAAASYRQALRIHPTLAEAHSNLADALIHQGRLDEAVASCQQALRINPNLAQAHNNLGNALGQQGRIAEALASYRQALAINPDFAEAHNNLGNTARQQGRLDEALAAFRQVLRLLPHNAGAFNNLGNTLLEAGQPHEAAACFRNALHINPNIAEVHNNLGNAFLAQGLQDEAMACYRQALRINPRYANVHYNLANLLMGQGKLAEAVTSFHQALEINPQAPKIHNNLGTVLKEQGRLPDAVVHYREALRIKPDMAEAYFNLGNALRQLNRLSEAGDCYRRAVQLIPNYPAALSELIHLVQHLCLWEELGCLPQQLLEAYLPHPPVGKEDAVAPFNILVLPTETTAAQQLQAAAHWVSRYFLSLYELGQNRRESQKNATAAGNGTAQRVFATSGSVPHSLESASVAPAVRNNSKITLGYLSSDFHGHATTYLIAELFEKHDRDRFQVLGYSYGPKDASPIRQRLMRAFDRFADVKDLSFEHAAGRIAGDGVDILIDLKGYTMNTRTEIAALRPAPIQVNYLGYPGTMAAPFIDYILVDDFIVPADQQPYFTEKLVHLPGCYQVNDSQREISPNTPSQSDCGLPEVGFVFCSFNNSYKITPQVFDVWMRLLQAVPGSVLWLLEGNPQVSANLRRQAEARGVAAERLVFAPRLPLPDHLARHRLAGLFLDTFPVNAHTTASDALWAGCPVLTIAGQTFISRVAGSLLRTLGLPELIATSIAEYEELALRLAVNPDLLAELQTRLAANRKSSGLFDAGRFARSVEKAYSTMWEIYAAGEKPRAFGVAD